MNPELQKQLFTRLDEIANKLGVGVSALWSIYLRQARIQAINDTVWVVVSLIGFGMAVKKIKKIRQNTDEFELRLFIVFIIWVLSCVLFASHFHDALVEWFNPGYYAWNELIDKIRN